MPAPRKDDQTATQAPEDDKLDRLLSLMDSIGSRVDATSARMDAFEKKAGPETAKAAEDAKEEEVDKPRAKTMLDYAQDERDLVAAQSKADSAFNLHGKRAPMPMAGEQPIAYRTRMVDQLKKFSDAFKGVDLNAIARADRTAFDAIESKIYADSAVASERPEVPEGVGLMIRSKRNPDTDRLEHHFFGPNTFIKEMASPFKQYVKKIYDGRDEAKFIM